MPTVYSGNDSIGYSPTNITTRSADEIAAQSGPFGTTRPISSGSINPSQLRLNIAGLFSGGAGAPKIGGTATNNIQFAGATTGSGTQDWRVRVSVAPGSKVLYDAPSPGILACLKETNGVIFPYTPNLTVNHIARYSTQTLTHTNYNNYFYEGSEVRDISITADFTAQSASDAKYLLAAIYFFRAATKMFFGESESYQGSPPPIVYLDGYGSHYLPHISCVVTGFQHTMPPDVDYIEVNASAGNGGSAGTGANGFPINPAIAGPISTSTGATRVPTMSQLQITLQPVYSRSAQRQFNYDAFARGELIVGQNRTTGFL